MRFSEGRIAPIATMIDANLPGVMVCRIAGRVAMNTMPASAMAAKNCTSAVAVALVALTLTLSARLLSETPLKRAAS